MTRATVRSALILATTLLGLAEAQAASPYPVNIETQRGSTLVIKHTPPPGEVRVRKAYRAKAVRRHRAYRPKAAAVRKVHRRKVVAKIVAWRHNPALAGGCRDGGYVRVGLPSGTVHTLHRDVCEGIAPIDSRPGAIRPGRWR
jgi:hypothetical protein